MRQISVPRLFAAAAGLIVLGTIVSMILTFNSSRGSSANAPTTTVKSGAATTVPRSTVPVAGTTEAVTTTTLLGEIIPAATTTTLPPTPTLPPKVPTELLIVGGNSAQGVGNDLANRLWPMKVRMVTGDPVSEAVKILTPKATSQLIVFDPSVPADPAAYEAYINSITAAAGSSRVLWLEEWRTDRGAWRDAVAKAARRNQAILVVPFAADAARNAWGVAGGGLSEAGRVEAVTRIAVAAMRPR
jgi:hypothetical protein